jgi:hypothetical protein
MAVAPKTGCAGGVAASQRARLGERPNKSLKRTGEQRCCLARSSHQRFVVGLPPPLSSSVSARDANQAMTYAPRVNGSRCHLRYGSSGRRALSQTSVQGCRRRRRWAAAGAATRRGFVTISGTPEPPSGVRALTSHSSGRGNSGGVSCRGAGEGQGWVRPRRLVRVLGRQGGTLRALVSGRDTVNAAALLVSGSCLSPRRRLEPRSVGGPRQRHRGQAVARQAWQRRQGRSVRLGLHLPWRRGPEGGPTSHSSGRGGQRWCSRQWSRHTSVVGSPPAA